MGSDTVAFNLLPAWITPNANDLGEFHSKYFYKVAAATEQPQDTEMQELLPPPSRRSAEDGPRLSYLVRAFFSPTLKRRTRGLVNSSTRHYGFQRPGGAILLG